MGSVLDAAGGISRIKLQPNSRSGAGSFLLRGEVRRVQIEASQETSTADKADVVASSPPAAGGWRRRSRVVGAPWVSPHREALFASGY